MVGSRISNRSKSEENRTSDLGYNKVKIKWKKVNR